MEHSLPGDEIEHLAEPERLQPALQALLARADRLSQPEGTWRDGIWHPSPRERRPCCDGIQPTPRNKQALEAHCRTALHVASLYDLPASQLRAALRAEVKRSKTAPIRPEPENLSIAELQQKTYHEAVALFFHELAQSLPVLLALENLRGSDCAKELLVPLFETASHSASRLLASCQLAYNSAASLACSETWLQTLSRPQPANSASRTGVIEER